MPKFVRVVDPVSKAHITVTEAFARKHSLSPLNQPATDRIGNPLPAKPRENKLRTEPVRQTEDAQPSDIKKEND